MKNLLKWMIDIYIYIYEKKSIASMCKNDLYHCWNFSHGIHFCARVQKQRGCKTEAEERSSHLGLLHQLYVGTVLLYSEPNLIMYFVHGKPTDVPPRTNHVNRKKWKKNSQRYNHILLLFTCLFGTVYIVEIEIFFAENV